MNRKFLKIFTYFLLDSDRSKSKKKKKRSDKSKQRSMSPLSRRMAMFSGNVDGNHVEAAGLSGSNAAYNYPQMFSGASGSEAGLPNDYDLRVNKFLDMTRDEDNYEEKVRKFVEEASKYKKERKNQESKKKDRKKSKKNKKDSKKKKKEKKSKSSKKDKEDVIDGNELREALKYMTFFRIIFRIKNSWKYWFSGSSPNYRYSIWMQRNWVTSK